MLEMFKLLKIERRRLIFKQNNLSRRSAWMSHEGHYRSEDLSTDKLLGVLSHGDNKNLAGLANFDFRIL